MVLAQVQPEGVPDNDMRKFPETLSKVQMESIILITLITLAVIRYINTAFLQ